MRWIGRAAWVVLVMGWCGVQAAPPPGNEGQQDLLKATQARLNAKTLSDLSKVIDLCESALAKGLDEQNRQIATKLMASALSQRGIETAKNVFDTRPPDPRWPQWRRVALEDLEKAVELDSDQAEAFYWIAQLNVLPGGDLKRARDASDQAIQHPKLEPAYQVKALLLRADMQKDLAKRLTDLNRAVEVAAGDGAVLRARAEALADARKFDEALADLDAALKLDPKDLRALEQKALVLGRMKRFDEAKAVLREARKLDADSIAPLLREARLYAMIPDHRAAVQVLDEAQGKEPGNVQVLLMRAGEYWGLGEKERAQADLEKALQLRPGLLPALRLRALFAADEGRYDQALADLKALVAEDPTDTDGLLQLGMVYQAAGQPEHAIEVLSKLLAEDPANGLALRARGDSLLAMGRHAEAIADYEKAYALRPDDPSLLNNFSWVLSTSPIDKLRNGKRALELAKEACRLTDYQQAHILSTLAAAYAELGDFKSAIEWSQKAVAAGKEDQKEELRKELETYKAGKPFREMKTVGSESKAKSKTVGSEPQARSKGGGSESKAEPQPTRPSAPGSP